MGVTAQINVKVFDSNTRIGVRVERCGWVHSFEVKLKDGLLPPGFAGDPEIVDAYRKIQKAVSDGSRKG